MTEACPPSIYVIGGLPRAGKTTLGRRLARKLRADTMETDHLRMLFNAQPGSRIGYEDRADIRECTARLRPYLEALIAGTAGGPVPVVINGEAVDPGMVAELPHTEAIRACFMGLCDPAAAYRRIRAADDPHDWAARLSDDRLQDILGRYGERSCQLAGTCDDLGIPYFDSSLSLPDAQREAYAYMKLGVTTIRAAFEAEQASD